jgi:5-formyltetrahydrofolate cyclo-ligase
VWTKKSLRQEIKARLKGHSAQERTQKSLLIEKKLFAHPAFRKARTVCFFVGLGSEVHTVPMIEKAIASGKRVLVPRTDLENKELKLFEVRDVRLDLKPGVLGILEPDPAHAKAVPADQVEVIAVPGLAFDKMNNRLGRGAGYYDRFLAGLPSSTLKVGLAFSFQVLPDIPYEDHDHRLDEVLTD